MIISVNWLKQYTEIDLPINELATLIGARLVEIEEVIDLGAKYKGVVVARVVTCEKLEGSDHLNVTMLDDGGMTENVERNGAGNVQVVCGAPNVKAGMLVAWLPPNTTVPETYGTAEPFVLSARPLRGVISNGMIASPRELALFEDHSGILEVDKDVVPGTSFAEAYELDDYLLDIENKSLTHRPDAFGIIGFAREVAAIQGKAFHTPEWLTNQRPGVSAEPGNIAVPQIVIDDPELAARYQAIVLQDADGKVMSPLQLQTYLARVGVRPISAVVDVTNYLMMLTGQPLHAFDYDKVVAIAGGKAEIHVRAGHENETLRLLDGRTITVTPDDIVIAAGETAVALAGAMGGADTEIDENTKNILLESATFNLYNLRATQMRHGIFSEAITRFTKGQPAELTAPVLASAANLLQEHAGAKTVTAIAEAYPGKRVAEYIEVSGVKINGILGTSLRATDMAVLLKNAEFEVITDGDNLRVTAPYWRSDIHIDEDVAEEVGRLSGFDSIAPLLPPRDFTAVGPSEFDQLRSMLRQILVKAGSNEVFTYSFVHGDLLEKAGQTTENSYKIVNSISPNLQYYRQSITPSLLNLIHPNSKQDYDTFALFELNKVHPKSVGLTDEKVPEELDHLALVLTAKQLPGGAAFYEAKHMLDFLAASLGVTFSYAPLEQTSTAAAQPFEPKRSAKVMGPDGEVLGVVGEYKKSVSRVFKLPDQVAGFEMDTRKLFALVQSTPLSYRPPSRYPSTERDVCFQVASGTPYGELEKLAVEYLASTDLETSVTPVDIYQAEANSDKKNLTVKIKLTSHDRTLTGEDANQVVDGLTDKVASALGATVI